jgi:hypothetical protein
LYGLVKLQTFTSSALSAGNHSILFEIGDVNDHILDSAVFISNLRAAAGTPGTNDGAVPEPATMALVGLSLAGLAGRRVWRKIREV